MTLDAEASLPSATETLGAEILHRLQLRADAAGAAWVAGPPPPQESNQ
jgi:hypothetical protein